MDGLPYLTYDSSEAVERFLKKKYRRLGGDDSNKCPANNNDVFERQPKKSKKNVQKEFQFKRNYMTFLSNALLEKRNI